MIYLTEHPLAYVTSTGDKMRVKHLIKAKNPKDAAIKHLTLSKPSTEGVLITETKQFNSDGDTIQVTYLYHDFAPITVYIMEVIE